MKLAHLVALPLLALAFAACGGPQNVSPTVGSFALTINPASITVTQGSSASVTVTLDRQNGFAGAVGVALVNPPAGITIAALTIPSGSSADVLTVTADASAALGLHTLSLVTTSGTVSHAVSLQLTLLDASSPDFALVLEMPSLAVKQSQSVPVNVALTRFNGFDAEVTLTIASDPSSGLSAPSVTIPAGGNSGTLNVSASSSAALGSGNATVQGAAGALGRSVALPWTILSASNPDFALNTSGGLSVIQGSSDGLTVTVNRQNGFGSAVDVTLADPPAGITAGPLTIPAGSSSGFLSVAVGAQVALGAIDLTLIGTASGLTRTLKQTLTVVATPDLTAPTLVSSSPGNNASGVILGTNVILTFSEPMNTNLTEVTLSPLAPAIIRHWSGGDTVLKLSLVQTLPGAPSNLYAGSTAYSVGVQGEDIAGNALGGTQTFSFTTQSATDTTAPTVLSSVPASGDQGVAPGVGKTFAVTFSEPMGAKTLSAINFVPNAGSSNCVFGDASHVSVQCTPSGGLAANQFYIMTITTAAQDAAGNPLAQLNAVSFTTGPTPDTTAPSILTRSPGNGLKAIDPNTSIQVSFSEAMNKSATQAAFNLLTPALTSGETLNFFWNATATTMFVKRGTPFAYGAAVTWNVAPSAKDLSGNLLQNSSGALQEFTVVRQGKFKLYSDGTLDAAISNEGTVDLPTSSNPIQQVGYSGKQPYKRGFITFDLQKLPKLVLITSIQSASLHVYQDVSQCGSPYSFLGDMIAENISYPALSFLFFNAAPISTGTTNILSTNAAVGYKVMEVSKQVGYDVQNRNGLLNRSQWRLRMTKDFPAQATNTCYFMFMATGLAGQSKQPYLDITYLYP